LRPDTHAAKQLLSKINAGHLKVGGLIPQSFTPREVVQKSWAGLDSTEAAYKAADLLAEYGWLEKEVSASSDPLRRGRHSTRYWIHPKLLKGGA
jgi:putative DNA primase/helicase